ncbi:hypothetical protein [Bradyrhizobium sp. Gha]|uniref:hypothetical protein n=1 Tax=Bradyrhizobium sp. Gha TaxID=1855318 RepID=UPI000B860D47|nr:hypothetical protein [Bradyrhizobium sp. Gha]
MKILITDDQSNRYQRLVTRLEAIGVKRGDIQFVQSTRQARDVLEKTYCDILILDIVVPLWPDQDPAKQHSLDLLFELHETESMIKPGRIVGLTADREVADDALGSFMDWTWTILEYSSINDEWIDRCINCVKYEIEQSEAGRRRAEYGVDLAVVCALASPELEEVLKLRRVLITRGQP